MVAAAGEMDNAFLLEHAAPLRVAAMALALTGMAAWEALAPRRSSREPKARRWRTNLGVALLNVLLVRVALPTTAIGMAELAAARGWGLFNQMEIEPWLAVVIGVLALDLFIYLQHVAFHLTPVLMRIHSVHHADPDVDATTGIRFHPLEIMLSMLVKYAAIVALGAPALAVLLFEMLLGVSSLFNHGNVRVPETIDRALRFVLVTPDMHRIHHSVIDAERNSNYGSCTSAWDRLFGTYTLSPAGGQTGMRLGLDGYRDARVSTTLSGALAIPFRTS